jgi:NAD(P)-dependent dehydrogenase (short-subunit alcohol dehydrogenase family)
MKRSLFLTLGGLALAGCLISRATRRTFSFSKKVVLITGGSRGLGLVLARQLCAEGARVALLARDPDELARARDELVRRGGEVTTISCDLLDHAQIESAVQDVVDHFGGIDVLINNAGIIEVGPLEHVQREDFERAMNLHFWAPYNLIMKAIPHLRRRGEGRIVNIASIGGKVAVPHLAPYCASKFALVGLSDALRTELARDNIHVTTVTPGMMRTGSHVNAKFKGDHRAEYTWFAISAALPLVSLKAERAAAKIISACRRGSPSLTIPFSTRALIIGNALFPNITGSAMKLANSILPPPGDPEGDSLRSGWESRSETSMLRWLARFTDRTTAQNNEARGADDERGLR